MSAVRGSRVGRAAICAALGLLIMVLGTGCASTSIPLTATPSVSTFAPPTPMAPPAGPLTWTSHGAPITAPPRASWTPALAVAPSDGSTAYMCAPGGHLTPSIVSVWVTRDRGTHWTRTGSVIVDIGGPQQVQYCTLFVDGDQAGTVIVRAGLPTDGCAGCTIAAPYVTTDFGAHWAPLLGPAPRGYPFALATRRAVTYALFGSPPASASPADLTFVKGTDGMRTWAPVDIPLRMGSGLAPEQEQVFAFWLNPVTGALLAQASNSYFLDEHFWMSADGTTWTQLHASPFPFDLFVVQQPFTDATWRICGGEQGQWYFGPGQINQHPLDIACTADSGAHWVVRHLDSSLTSDPNTPYEPVAIADDGDMLLTISSTLYGFAIGTGGFESLGPVPNTTTPVYAAGAGDGVLWVGPFNYQPNPDAQGRIFTASYA
jgi:hypothetical protein